MKMIVKKWIGKIVIPFAAMLMVLFLSSFSTQAQSTPGKPGNVQISWKKGSGSCPYCNLTLIVSPSNQGGAPTSYHWEIWRLDNIDYQKTTTGKTWAIGYIEPTDTYTVKVKAINAAGQSEQFIKTFNPPSGCCVK